MENRLSFQTTMKSRGLLPVVASEIILVNSSRLPGVSLNVADTVLGILVFVRLLGLLHRLFQARASSGRSTSCRRMPAIGLSPGSGRM